jgi:hypothetical protein
MRPIPTRFGVCGGCVVRGDNTVCVTTPTFEEGMLASNCYV